MDETKFYGKPKGKYRIWDQEDTLTQRENGDRIIAFLQKNGYNVNRKNIDEWLIRMKSLKERGLIP